jgi:hypothetical protein
MNFIIYKFQNANVDENNEVDDSKADVNWYSSDEEEPPEPVPETTSPLATLLRTIQTSSSSSNSSNIPSTEKKIDCISASSNLFSTPAESAENESVPVSINAPPLVPVELKTETNRI